MAKEKWPFDPMMRRVLLWALVAAIIAVVFLGIAFGAWSVIDWKST